MKYAIINFRTNEDSFYEYVMIDSNAKFEDVIEKVSRLDGVKYDTKIVELTAEEYSKEFQNEIKNRIQREYEEYIHFDKNIAIKEYSNWLNDIDTYNKAITLYNTKCSIQGSIRREIDLDKITVKEFDEYVERLCKVYGTEEFGNVFEELKNKVK